MNVLLKGTVKQTNKTLHKYSITTPLPHTSLCIYSNMYICEYVGARVQC